MPAFAVYELVFQGNTLLHHSNLWLPIRTSEKSGFLNKSTRDTARCTASTTHKCGAENNLQITASYSREVGSRSSKPPDSTSRRRRSRSGIPGYCQP